MLQKAVAASVNEARECVKSCMRLNKALRGTDLLAERVRRLRDDCKQIETALANVL